MRTTIIVMALLFLIPAVRPAEARMRVAVLDFAPGNVPRGVTVAVRDLFEVALHKSGTAEMIERTRVDLVMKERRLTDTACADSRCAVTIGRLLKADAVVIGGVSRMGVYLITVKVVDIGTGKIEIAESEQVPGENEMAGSVAALAKKISSRMTAAGSPGNTAKKMKHEGPAIDILAGVSYVVPLPRLARLYQPGFEASVELGFARLASGFTMGIDAGYLYSRGKVSYVNHCISVPLRIFAGYQFHPVEWLYFSLSASGGMSYNSVMYNNSGVWYGHPAGTGREFEPVLRCNAGIGFLYKALHIRISGLHNTVFEASEPLCSAGATIEIGVRL